MQRWVKVRLLFVQGCVKGEKAQPGKHDWAVFLTTDLTLSPQRILQLYALRWAIEVYFKEAKQHLGFLKEQGAHYAGYIASIHLTAIRFCLLAIAKHEYNASSIAIMRQNMCGNVMSIDQAARLWPTFHGVIAGALDSLKSIGGNTLDLVMIAIELHMQAFFTQALQLDEQTLHLEAT